MPARGGDVVDPYQGAVVQHRGQHLQQLVVRRIGLGHVAQQVGVEHGGAVEVVLDGEHLLHQPAGRSGTEDGAQRQHGVARDLVAGEGGEPAGSELGGCHPAAPVQVDREALRDHAVHQPGRHRVAVPRPGAGLDAEVDARVAEHLRAVRRLAGEVPRDGPVALDVGLERRRDRVVAAQVGAGSGLLRPQHALGARGATGRPHRGGCRVRPRRHGPSLGTIDAMSITDGRPDGYTTLTSSGDRVSRRAG